MIAYYFEFIEVRSKSIMKLAIGRPLMMWRQRWVAGGTPLPRHMSPRKTATMPLNKHWISMIETAILQNKGYDKFWRPLFASSTFAHHHWNLSLLFLHRLVCRTSQETARQISYTRPTSNVSPIWAVGGEQKVDNLEGARPNAHCPPSMGDGRWAR